MAEEEQHQTRPVRLWAAEGGVIAAEVQYEAESAAAAQPLVVEYDGTYYVWDLRNGQYRVAELVHAALPVVQDEPEPAAQKAPEPPPAGQQAGNAGDRGA